MMSSDEFVELANQRGDADSLETILRGGWGMARESFEMFKLKLFALF